MKRRRWGITFSDFNPKAKEKRNQKSEKGHFKVYLRDRFEYKNSKHKLFRDYKLLSQTEKKEWRSAINYKSTKILTGFLHGTNRWNCCSVKPSFFFTIQLFIFNTLVCFSIIPFWFSLLFCYSFAFVLTVKSMIAKK